MEPRVKATLHGTRWLDSLSTEASMAVTQKDHDHGHGMDEAGSAKLPSSRSSGASGVRTRA